MIDLQAMDIIRQQKGKKLAVSVIGGESCPELVEGTLVEFEPFRFLSLRLDLTTWRGIPFIGWEAAIEKITANGEVIYENPCIQGYNGSTEAQINEARKLSFSEEVFV